MTFRILFHRAMILQRLCFFLTICVNSPLAQASTEMDFCRNLHLDKSKRALLFSASGKERLTYFNLGNLDVTTAEPDEYLIAKQFRIVLFPKQLSLEALGGRDFAVDLQETKARCPSTKEYLVSFRVNPTILGSGRFDNEFQAIRFLDNRLDFPELIHVKATYKSRIVGAISMPNIQAKETPANKDALSALFKNKTNNVTISLENIGDRPIELGQWEDAEEQQKRELIIVRNSCENARIDSFSRCDITFQKVSNRPLNSSLYSWVTKGKAGNYLAPIILDIEKFSDNHIGFGIRHH